MTEARTSRLAVEAVVQANVVSALASRLAVEALQSVDAPLTGVVGRSASLLWDSEANTARASRLALEALTQGSPATQVDRFAAEVLTSGEASATVAQLSVEALQSIDIVVTAGKGLELEWEVVASAAGEVELLWHAGLDPVGVEVDLMWDAAEPLGVALATLWDVNVTTFPFFPLRTFQLQLDLILDAVEVTEVVPTNTGSLVVDTASAYRPRIYVRGVKTYGN